MHQLCHGRRLLTDGVINADHILALLVQDGVNGNRGLTGLAVTDDQLTLATPNGEHRVNGQNTGSQRGIYRLPIHNGGCRFFNRAVVVGLDLALAVDGLAQSVDNTANKALAYRHAGTLMGTHSGRALVDLAILAKQDATDLVLLNILDHALDPGVKHHDLAVHGVVHTVNGGNAVAYANNLAHFLVILVKVVIGDLLAENGYDLIRTDCCHYFTSPVSFCCNLSNLPFTERSYSQSPQRRINPPSKSGCTAMSSSTLAAPNFFFTNARIFSVCSALGGSTQSNCA